MKINQISKQLEYRVPIANTTFGQNLELLIKQKCVSSFKSLLYL